MNEADSRNGLPTWRKLLPFLVLIALLGPILVGVFLSGLTHTSLAQAFPEGGLYYEYIEVPFGIAVFLIIVIGVVYYGRKYRRNHSKAEAQ